MCLEEDKSGESLSEGLRQDRVIEIEQLHAPDSDAMLRALLIVLDVDPGVDPKTQNEDLDYSESVS